MHRLGRWRPLRATVALLLACALVPVPARAQAPPPAGRAPEVLSEAREQIKNGDYDSAIQSLDGLLGRARDDQAVLRDAYLLLIKTYVFMGNELRFKPQGREASKLHHQAARERIEACLQTPALRHTRPEPASEYPQEMIAMFAEVRGRIFGAFRVVGLDPAGAVVTFDGDTLVAAPGDSLPGDVDLAVGTHQVAVAAEGRRPVVEEITISPGATLEKTYLLPKARTRVWYATTIGATLGVVGGLVAILAGRGGDDGGPGTLPEPPGPPN